MDAAAFQEWLASVDALNEEQKRAVVAALNGESDEVQVLAALEGMVGPERQCPRCSTAGAHIRGKANGLTRYCCKGCKRTFNAITGTPLARLRKRDQWLTYSASLSARETISAAQDRCGVARTTAFRWRQRFLEGIQAVTKSLQIEGLIEADDLEMKISYKGRRRLRIRKPRQRGGAGQPGSDRTVSVLFLAGRDGTTILRPVRSITAENIRCLFEEVIQHGSILITDAAKAMIKAGKWLKAQHEIINVSRDGRTRGPYHLQGVNNRHMRFRAFLTPFMGIATKYLINYLSWFSMVALGDQSSPRDCFALIVKGAMHSKR